MNDAKVESPSRKIGCVFGMSMLNVVVARDLNKELEDLSVV